MTYLSSFTNTAMKDWVLSHTGADNIDACAYQYVYIDLGLNPEDDYLDAMLERMMDEEDDKLTNDLPS